MTYTPPIVPESNDPREFPVFKDIGVGQYLEWRSRFIPYIKGLAKRLPYHCDVHYNVNHISLIYDMLQRRRVYYYVFHAFDLGELNEACLTAFWILKLGPFFDPSNPQRNLNLDLALHVFTDGVRYFVNKNNRKAKQKLAANLNLGVLEHLRHAFLVRDLSKEAVMALAQGLVHEA